MSTYEKPAITEIASIADLTRGDWAEDGSDSLSWLNPILGHFGFPGLGDGGGS